MSHATPHVLILCSSFLTVPILSFSFFFFFFFNDTATTEIYTLSLHDALPIFSASCGIRVATPRKVLATVPGETRSEEHTSELQSLTNLVCRLLLEKKKKKKNINKKQHKQP